MILHVEYLQFISVPVIKVLVKHNQEIYLSDFSVNNAAKNSLKMPLRHNLPHLYRIGSRHSHKLISIPLVAFTFKECK